MSDLLAGASYLLLYNQRPSLSSEFNDPLSSLPLDNVKNHAQWFIL